MLSFLVAVLQATVIVPLTLLPIINPVGNAPIFVSMTAGNRGLGASMAQTLRAHADLLRTRRRQRAEEAARKLPIKMLFPLAFFILPALMIVVAGPAMLKLQDLMKLLIG